ncbi:MAG: glycosyltransferase family 4 protein, partial [Candidatus Heimdallarchaeota archaeon]|nr:glycosyltransferase family 4 protein [Candidatus Heimdallarchaeota archaeon]
MKIAIITYQYPPGTGQSGIANYTRNLAHGLVSRGNEVHVIAHTDPEDGDEQELMDGKVYVHRIREPRWTQKISLLKVFAYRWRIYQKTNELQKKYGLDIVECPNSIFQGVLLCSLPKRFPVVMRVHTPMFEIFESSFGKIPFRFKVISLFEKLAVLKSDALVTSTDFYAKKVSDAYRISKDRFTVVPLGINMPEIDQLNLKPNNNMVRILFVGRLEERKGIRYLLEAVPEVVSLCSSVEFVFAGKDVGGFRR